MNEDPNQSEGEDSVYDETYQEINKRQHPMLRTYKLSKRIRKDKRMSNEQRKALKTRLNIIQFRIRKNSAKLDDELMNRLIPALQHKLVEKYGNIFPAVELALPTGFC